MVRATIARYRGYAVVADGAVVVRNELEIGEHRIAAKEVEREIRDREDRATVEVDLLDEAFDTFKSLKPRDLIESEQLWREIIDRYGEYYIGGMGAEYVKDLIARTDLLEEVDRPPQAARAKAGFQVALHLAQLVFLDAGQAGALSGQKGELLHLAGQESSEIAVIFAVCATGRITRNSVPRSTSEATCRVPPCSVTICCTGLPEASIQMVPTRERAAVGEHLVVCQKFGAALPGISGEHVILPKGLKLGRAGHAGRGFRLRSIVSGNSGCGRSLTGSNPPVLCPMASKRLSLRASASLLFTGNVSKLRPPGCPT